MGVDSPRHSRTEATCSKSFFDSVYCFRAIKVWAFPMVASFSLELAPILSRASVKSSSALG